MTTMQIEQTSVESLIPYARNSRTHSDAQVAQIAASIKEFGWTNPILVDGENGLIAGHGRLLAARKLGMTEVPVIRLEHLDENQKRALIIADNKLALNSGWDEEMLKIELQELSGAEYDLSVLGFEESELEALLAEQVEATEGNTDADEVPEAPVNPITKPGDVWIMGGHRLMCGDSTSIESVEQLMGGVKADLLLTDPPYNVAYEGKTADALTIENDSMADADFRQFLRDVYATADAVMRPGAVFYIWHADSEGYNFRGAAHDIGWRVRQCLIWNKNSLVLGRQDYHWKHEPCLYGWKDGAGHYWGNDRKQTTVLDFNRPSRNGEHPTMKPVDLFWYQVDNSSKNGDVVLDLFGGSGTTMIACEKSGRISRLMELDPKYCDVIVKRWQDFTGKEAVLEATGDAYNSLAKTQEAA